MTISTRNQLASVFAAIACAFLTIGVSVAPAVAPVAPISRNSVAPERNLK
ncbi:MAG: hypothetical protein IPG54_04715 [Sphingomonadales bacterium]|nr:hypothetical protein [Sphingomonadales bacterium]